MKILLYLILGIFTILIACICYNYASSKPPSREVLRTVTALNPAAERLMPSQIKKWHAIFQEYKSQAGRQRLDLYAQKKALEAELGLPVDSASLTASIVNDSILFIEECRGTAKEQERNKISIYPRQHKFIFHANGDIEAKIGNMVSRSEDEESDLDGTFLLARLDGETGLILNYSKKDLGARNAYTVSETGEIDRSEKYACGSAASVFASLDYYLEKVEELMSK